jgi:RND family efflux transporter MFP subunit
VNDDRSELPVDAEGPPKVPRRKRWWWVLVALGLVGILGAGAWLGARVVNVLLTRKPRIARLVGNPIPVTVAPVTREEISEVIGGTTLAESFLSIALNSVVTQGRVDAVPVELGQAVRPGHTLLEFDVKVFREALERARLQVTTARADLRKTEAEQKTRSVELRDAVVAARKFVAYSETAAETSRVAYERTKALYEQQVVALAELEQAKVKWDQAVAGLSAAALGLVKAENELKNEAVVAQAEIEAARAKLGVAEQELAQAEKNMENTVVVAPRAGVVSQRLVDPGEWVKAAQALLVVDQIDPIFAVAQIEQEKSTYVSLGQVAEVVFDALPTETRRGPIVKIDPSIDPLKRTFKAFVRLDNPSLELRPGHAAFTRVTSRRTVTLLPRVGIINPTGAPSTDATVFVVEESRAVVRKVKLGKPVGVGSVEVLSGVEPGEWVVIYGQLDLNPGDVVTPEKLDPERK